MQFDLIDGDDNTQEVYFCGMVLERVFGTTDGKMIVRFRNPRQSGFVKVVLRTDPRLSHMWRWEIPSLPNVRSAVNVFLGRIDSILNERFPSGEGIVWVKMIPA